MGLVAGGMGGEEVLGRVRYFSRRDWGRGEGGRVFSREPSQFLGGKTPLFQNGIKFYKKAESGEKNLF